MSFRPKNFVKAKRWLAEAAKFVVRDGQIDLPAISFEKAMISVLPGVHAQANGWTYWIDDLTGARLADWAIQSPEGFDAVLEVCAYYVLAGEAMPAGLRSLAFEVLAQKRARPKKEGRPKKDNFPANTFIIGTTLAAARFFSLTPTRHSVDGARNSACDAMSEALAELGVSLSYEKIKALITNPNYSDLRRRVELYERFALAKEARPLNALAWNLAGDEHQEWPMLSPPSDGDA